MKKFAVGQGDQVNVNLEVNGRAICSIVFGSASGHPFSGCWQGTDSTVEAATASVFGACALLALHLLSDANFDAVVEFLAQLGEEAIERKEAAPESSPDDDTDFPF